MLARPALDVFFFLHFLFVHFLFVHLVGGEGFEPPTPAV